MATQSVPFQLNIGGDPPQYVQAEAQFNVNDTKTQPTVVIDGKTVGTQTSNGTFEAAEGAADLNDRSMNSILTSNKNSINNLINANLYANSTSDQRSAWANANKPFNTYVDARQDQENFQAAVEAVEDIDITIGSVGVRGLDPSLPPYRHYYYPADLESSKQDRIKFTMKSYGNKKIKTGSLFEQDYMVRKFKKIEGSVTLPINPTIQDQNTVNWQGGTLNALESRGAGIAMSLMNSQSWEQVTNQVADIFAQTRQELMGSFDNYGSDLINAMQVYLAQQAVGTRNLLSRTTGAIVYPNLELLFEAPQLRSFQFQFQLSPRDNNEAKHTKQLIRFFKQGMSVKSSSSNVFLKAPNVFDIRYISFNNEGRELDDHPSIGRIKTAALTSCQVNYTPDGTYMTYADDERTMTSYRVNLQFTELNPVYEDDYNNRNLREEDGTWSRPLSTAEVGY